MDAVALAFLDKSRSLIRADYLPKIERCLDELLSRRQIQGYDVTVLEAIYHVVEHFGMHTGQIIMLSKSRAGQDLKLWVPPKM